MSDIKVAGGIVAFFMVLSVFMTMAQSSGIYTSNNIDVQFNSSAEPDSTPGTLSEGFNFMWELAKTFFGMIFFTVTIDGLPIMARALIGILDIIMGIFIIKWLRGTG